MEQTTFFDNRTNHSLSLAQRTGPRSEIEGLISLQREDEALAEGKRQGCGSLTLIGFIATNTGLLTGKSKSGNDYVYNDFQLRTDEEHPMRPWFHLTGEMAQQFSAIQLSPEMQARVTFRLYSREYPDHNGVTRHSTELGVTLIEILDIEGEVIHVCQKSL